jgi:hypothetical protein
VSEGIAKKMNDYPPPPYGFTWNVALTLTSV